jgi:flavin-dependent dehydrogenase
MKICVLGCGPAGAVTALGLHELGHDVLLAGVLRPYPVTEGISARVCRALADKRLQRTLSQVGSPVPRHALWNGESRAANTEHLVYRPDFDRALMADLGERGVAWRQAKIRGRRADGSGWLIDLETTDGTECLEADYIVEARGRSAGYPGRERLRGPETVSVGMNWNSDAGSPFTAVASLQKGWLWLARHEDGRLFSQYTTHSKCEDLSPRQAIPALLDRLLEENSVTGVSVKQRRPAGEPMARSSTAILPEASAEFSMLRVGDAAMAVDPLSGNGIFQSLSSALAAPAVINTVLRRPDDAGMALNFYRERLEHLFFRFARIGRDFYALEKRWAGAAFWEARAKWPDQEPAHTDSDRVLGRARRPVIHHGFIEQRTVIVTEGQPLGAAHVATENLSR